MAASQPTVAELAESVEQLENQLARLIEVVAQRLSGPNPAARSDQTADGQDEDAESKLSEWVAEISERYYLRFVLQGWQDNTAIRAELEALRLAHQAAFADDAGAFDQVYWHDALARTLQRISTEVGYPKQRAAEEADVTPPTHSPESAPTTKPADREATS